MIFKNKDKILEQIHSVKSKSFHVIKYLIFDSRREINFVNLVSKQRGAGGSWLGPLVGT